MTAFVPSIHADAQTNELRRLIFWMKREFKRVAHEEEKTNKKFSTFFQEGLHEEVQLHANASPPPALKPVTIARKIARGLPAPRQSWKATGFLLGNMFQSPYWAAGGRRFLIQPSRKWMRDDNGKARTLDGAPLTVERVMGWLEYGLPTNKQVARPAIRPAIQKIASGQSAAFNASSERAAQFLASEVMKSLRTHV